MLSAIAYFISGFVFALLLVLYVSYKYDAPQPYSVLDASARATFIIEEDGKIQHEIPIVYCIRRNFRGSCRVLSVESGG